MRVLIIGGTGFIGPPLVRRLVADGHGVAVFHRGRTKNELPLSVDHIIGDRRELGRYATEFRAFAPDVIVDMIAFTEKQAADLVDTFRGLTQRLVVISSADVYRAYGRFLGTEPGPIEPTPLSEDSPLRSNLFPYRLPAQGPNDFSYDYDKIPVEQIVLGNSDLPGTVLRLPMIHGPGDTYHRLAPYLKRIDDERPAIVLDDRIARWKCPRGYVENVASAIALTAVDERATGRAYNIADAIGDTEIDWVRKIGEAAGWRGAILIAPRGSLALPYHFEQDLDTDSTRIRRELAFTDVVDSQRALAETVKWERTNPGGPSPGFGLLDYDAEDALLAQMGHEY
jgi:nucleoside-diphosphate-sugar epimerase